MTSQWVNSEVDLAWKQKHTLTGKNIIPILYQICEIREDLDLLHIINFLAPIPYEEAFQNLLLALGISKQQKTQEQGIEGEKLSSRQESIKKQLPHSTKFLLTILTILRHWITEVGFTELSKITKGPSLTLTEPLP